MRTITLFLITFFCTYLFAQDVFYVTNTNDIGEGSLREALYSTINGGTIIVDESLKDQTIYLSNSLKNKFVDENTCITILGNGVTISKITGPITDPTITFERQHFTIENITFDNIQINSTNLWGFVLKNCTVKNSEGISLTARTYDYDSDFRIIGSQFIGDSENNCTLKIRSTCRDEEIKCYLNVVSSSFINQNSASPISCTSYRDQSIPGITITNSIVISNDPETPIIEAPIVTSNGYNIIKGNLKVENLKTHQTDIIDSQIKTPLLEDENGIYKVWSSGAAYQNLPANTTIEGVSFPEKDILGEVIDYTQPIHSGACQATIDYVFVEGIAFEEKEEIVIIYLDHEPRLLNVLIKPIDATNQHLIWESENGAVVSVDQDGYITAVAEGITKVRVTTEEGGYSASINIAVYKDVKVTGVSLNKTKITIHEKDEYQLTATISPHDARNKELTWSSSNPEIAEIDENGKITSYLTGNTVITVTTADGGFTAQCEVTVTEPRFTDGVFFLNEDWFGHNNGSVNFLYDDGRWNYNIYKLINPGHDLGATTQYGMIYGGRFFICSKQGMRFVVCDAETMEMEAAFENFTDENGITQAGDARACVGVNSEKVYVSSTNGIWIYDVENQQFKGRIKGAESVSSGLYDGQVGMMVQAGNHIFAVHQNDGLLVINPETDQVESVIEGPTINNSQLGYGTLALARDGNIWATVGSSSSGLDEEGNDLLVKVDPFTFEYELMPIPAGRGVATGWGAWRAGTFFPSNNLNRLYWHKNSKIQVYDIDSGEMQEIYDISAYDENTSWSVYSAFRVHPVTEDVYMVLFQNYGSKAYRTIHVSGHTGELAGEYDMSRHYWFPAMPVFPDNYAPEIAEQPIRQITSTEEIIIPIEELVSDKDNLTAGIITQITEVSNPNLLEAEIVRYNLVIYPKEELSGNCVVNLTFNSNGKTVSTNLIFTADNPDSIEDFSGLITPSVNVTGKTLHIIDGENYMINVYNIHGQLVDNFNIPTNNMSYEMDVPTGVYILRGTNRKQYIQRKIVIR